MAPKGLLLVLLIGIGACMPDPETPTEHLDLSAVFDELGVKGSFLLYDETTQRFHSIDSARCRRRFLPASTFKIPNSLISLQTGALRDTGEIIRWDSIGRWNPDWNRDHTLRTAFRSSCVPCYQQLARRVGVGRMRALTQALDYGEMVIDTNNIDVFWLEGTSGINQFEQIDFLRRLQKGALPIEARHQEFVKDIMVVEQTPEYTLRAKSGWAVVKRLNIGWYVGWLSREENHYFFALNIQAPDTEPDFADKRLIATRRLLEQLEILPDFKQKDVQ